MGNEIASVLGIDPQKAAEVPIRIARQTFFNELAKHGVSPVDEEQAIELLEASDRLEAKRAEFKKATDPVNKALRSLLGSKQASAPAAQQQSTPVVNRGEVRAKVAEYLADPYIFGAMMAQMDT